MSESVINLGIFFFLALSGLGIFIYLTFLGFSKIIKEEMK
jgi:hypothetical protein